MMHSLRRTSPKGGPFIGICTACGKTGLTLKDMELNDCENLRGVTEEQSILEAIDPSKQLLAGYYSSHPETVDGRVAVDLIVPCRCGSPWGTKTDDGIVCLNLNCGLIQVISPAAPASADLAAICARCEAATEGPWTYDGRGDTGFDVLSPHDTCIASYMTERDAAFLTNAKTDIPALLTAIATLTAQLTEARAALKPFIVAAAAHHGFQDDQRYGVNGTITVGDLRRAAQASAEKET